MNVEENIISEKEKLTDEVSVSKPKPKRLKKEKKVEVVDPYKPKITRKLKKDISITEDKIYTIVRHIKNVQDNCLLMGEKFIERGLVDFGKELIARGFCHDNSKFYGIEWDNITKAGNEIDNNANAKLKLKLSIFHHQSTNKHHPESWAGGIKEMTDIDLCEMICDWKSRSEEFGTDLRKWIDESATKRYKFTNEDLVYKKIMYFVDMICEKPFVNV